MEDGTFIDSIKFANKVARGKYIMRLDADDILEPKAVGELVAYLVKYPFYSAVVPDHKLIGDVKVEKIRGGDSLDFPLPTGALIEKKKYNYVTFMEGQPFRDKINWVYSFEKYDFKIGYLHKPLLQYRIHDQSISHGGVTPEQLHAEENKIKEHFNQNGDKRKPNN